MSRRRMFCLAIKRSDDLGEGDFTVLILEPKAFSLTFSRTYINLPPSNITINLIRKAVHDEQFFPWGYFFSVGKSKPQSRNDFCWYKGGVCPF